MPILVMFSPFWLLSASSHLWLLNDKSFIMKISYECPVAVSMAIIKSITARGSACTLLWPSRADPWTTAW